MNNSKLLLVSLWLVVIVLASLFAGGISYQTTAHPIRDNVPPTQEPEVGIDKTLENELNAYAFHPGYPIYYDKWTERSSVTIADINNDGKNELLLPTYDGNIYAWDSDGNALSGFPFSVGSDWRLGGRLTLGDLNKDGDLEIAVALASVNPGVGGKINIYNPDRTLLWSQSTACSVSTLYCGLASIMLADIDLDTYFEVIAGTTNRDFNHSVVVPNLYVWEHTGTLKTGWPNFDPEECAIIGQMAVGDLNGDTYPDIVTGRDYNRLFAFNRNGTNLSGWPHYVWYPYDANDWTDDQIEFPRSSPALADLDLDGDLEYIVPGHRREAYSATYTYPELLIYNANATRFTGWELPATGKTLSWVSNTTKMTEAPAIADLNNDGQPEIILATQDGYVRAYTAKKQLLWEYNYYQGRQVHTSETVVGDVDGDGYLEIIFGTFWLDMVTKGNVGIYILNHNGTENEKLLLSSVGISNSPALGDLDGDGLIEIAAATYDGRVYVWDTPGQALLENMPWPMPRHDLQRTGLYVPVKPSFSQSSKIVNPTNAGFNEIVTYTIHLVRTGAQSDDIISLTDTIPTGMQYVLGSLTATQGIFNDSGAPMLTWTGTGGLFDNNPVDISFRAKVVTTSPGGITNTAFLNAGSAGEYELTVRMVVNGVKFYLPFIGR